MSDDTQTALDAAVLAAQADDARSGRVFDALFNSEMLLLLEEEPAGEAIRPVVLELEAGPTALAFDLADRLAAFSNRPAPYAAMPGRALVTMLAGQTADGRPLNLAINPGVAPSELFYGPEELAWAAEFLAEGLAVEDARVTGCGAPVGASQALLAALDAKLAALSMALAEAWLVRADYADKPSRLLLALRLRAPGGEAGVAQAVAETGRLADRDAADLDVAFLDEGDALLDQARRHGLGFEIPEPATRARPAPGMDPDRPPKLR